VGRPPEVRHCSGCIIWQRSPPRQHASRSGWPQSVALQVAAARTVPPRSLHSEGVNSWQELPRQHARISGGVSGSVSVVSEVSLTVSFPVSTASGTSNTHRPETQTAPVAQSSSV